MKFGWIKTPPDRANASYGPFKPLQMLKTRLAGLVFISQVTTMSIETAAAAPAEPAASTDSE